MKKKKQKATSLFCTTFESKPVTERKGNKIISVSIIHGWKPLEFSQL